MLCSNLRKVKIFSKVYAGDHLYPIPIATFKKKRQILCFARLREEHKKHKTQLYGIAAKCSETDNICIL